MYEWWGQEIKVTRSRRAGRRGSVSGSVIGIAQNRGYVTGKKKSPAG